MDNKEQMIESIKERIIAEHTKHKGLDWAEIAARKIYSSNIKSNVMVTKTYIGIIREDDYGFRTANGYEPSLSLECENGDSVRLGNSRYYSEFSGKVGQRIKLTIEELEPLGEE